MAGSRVVVAGYQIDASDHYSMIALAFDADGDLDTSFGTGGFSDTITSTDGIGGTHLSVTLLGDILIGGTTPSYPDQQVLAQICGG